MMAAIVQFRLRQPISLAEAHARSSAAESRYKDIPGLLRKYFTVSEDGGAIGGVYLWRSKEDAEAFYSAPWKASIVEKYGSAPTLTYLHVPVVVEPSAGGPEGSAP